MLILKILEGCGLLVLLSLAICFVVTLERNKDKKISDIAPKLNKLLNGFLLTSMVCTVAFVILILWSR